MVSTGTPIFHGGNVLGTGMDLTLVNEMWEGRFWHFLDSFLTAEVELQTLAINNMFTQVQREYYSQGITSLINSNKEHTFFKTG